MKKILPSIFIFLILVNIFAPLSVGTSIDNPIKIQKAEADDPTIGITIVPSTDGTSAVISGNFIIDNEKPSISNIPVYLYFEKSAEKLNSSVANNDSVDQVDPIYLGEETVSTGKIYKYSYEFTRTGLTKGSVYYAKTGLSLIGIVSSKVVYSSMVSFTAGGATVKVEGFDPPPLPECGIGGLIGIGGGTITGCAAQLIYYVLFVPTSYIFALTGQFFDYTFHYTVSNAAYESPFVLQGWGIVRDFCNIFFIFVLLYIAFRTILGFSGGHGPNTKQLIVNVVIIGLLINFSLFAAQVIIDSSNILARVFYNSDAIKITNGATGVQDATPKLKEGPNGEIPLSAAIVNKINPQNLIIGGRNIGEVKDNAGVSDSTNKSLSAGSFILITILAVVVNIVGIIVFISLAMMCITRVIGLWIYMIFAPLAFFSYTVPQMQGLKMIGWKNWWSQLLCYSFWAPLLIFFLYLIVAFLDTGLSLINVQGQTGVAFVIATVVPFAFIMILLWKAKDLAKTMGCEMASQITGGIAAIGGVALGGAALGAAAIGRKTIGSFMKGSSTGDNSGERALAGTSKNTFDKLKGNLFNATGVTALRRVVGSRVNKDEERVEGYAHARHELNKVAGEKFHGKKFEDLTRTQRETVREKITKDYEAQQKYGKKYNDITKTQKTDIDNISAPKLAAKTSQGDHLMTESKGKQGLVSKIVQSSRTGTYDVRNLSKVVTNEYDRGFSKVMTGLTSTIAGGMRGAFKQSGINYGTGQKDFFKDLGHTITEALKSTHVKVDLSHVGEEKKEGDHGGHH